MSKFINIVNDYNTRTAVEDDSIELHNWLALLTKFTDDKPLPRSLINSIDSHFSYYWKFNRLACLEGKEVFLEAL